MRCLRCFVQTGLTPLASQDPFRRLARKLSAAQDGAIATNPKTEVIIKMSASAIKKAQECVFIRTPHQFRRALLIASDPRAIPPSAVPPRKL